jgi:hypothetical protein
MNYEVIPSRVWIRDDGARASIYGAVPWVGDAEKARWKIVDQGWTVRNPRTGEVGVGRPPSATKEEAEALAAKLGRPSAICIGD